MVRLWHGQADSPWPRAVLVEHHQSNNGSTDPDAQEIEPPSYEAARTPDGLYVEYASGDKEYYDTRSDPYELHNLPTKAPPDMATMLHRLEKCSGASACAAAAGAG